MTRARLLSALWDCVILLAQQGYKKSANVLAFLLTDLEYFTRH